MAKITEKMIRFAEEYVKNGYNGAKAYKKAYNQEKTQVCASEAYKLLRDPRIIAQIELVEGSFRIIGQMAGIDKKTIVKVLADMLSATKKEKTGESVPDHAARKDAITLFAKLTGDFKEKKELEIKKTEDLSDIDPTKLSEEEREQLEKDILSEL
jgi:phage terminase small subunit